MSQRPRYATLIDGAFLIRKLASQLRRFPRAADIEAIAHSIAKHECLEGLSLLRVYFYHSRPATRAVTNPISKRSIVLADTPAFADHTMLLEDLEQTPDFALRLGETSASGWRIGESAFRRLVRQPQPIQADDLVPAIEQKGVDLRIGLDIARLALTHAVEAIVVVTSDSDFVPAFKFARREGMRVFLCHLEHPIKRGLLATADRVIRIDIPAKTLHRSPTEPGKPLNLASG